MTWTTGESPTTEARLAALETAVATLQQRVAALEAAGSTAASDAPYGSVQDATDPWSVPPWPEIVALLGQRRKIEAIKAYREHFGVGLKEAKDSVEEVERRLR